MTKSSQVDQDLIRAIAELLNKENLAEIEIEQEDFRVRVTRSYPVEAPAYAPAPMQYMAPPVAAAAAPAASVVPAAAPAGKAPRQPLDRHITRRFRFLATGRQHLADARRLEIALKPFVDSEPAEERSCLAPVGRLRRQFDHEGAGGNRHQNPTPPSRPVWPRCLRK